MKGLIFLEFMAMVENKFSSEMVEQIIAQSELPSGGSYTSIGTYDHREIVQLVAQLSKDTELAVPDLLRTFGNHLFESLAISFPQFFEDNESSFAFLKTVHDVIHVEVLKLYPDATLPVFEYDAPEPGCLVMMYKSPRSFEDLAEGLIEGCIRHYGEKISIQRETASVSSQKQINFILTRQD